jgi:hypothetical protein
MQCLFVGGPLDGEYRDIEIPVPESYGHLHEAPFTNVSDYQPNVTPYFVHYLTVPEAEPGNSAIVELPVYSTESDWDRFCEQITCPVCAEAGIYEFTHPPYPDPVIGDDWHGQYDPADPPTSIGTEIMTRLEASLEQHHDEQAPTT